MIRYHQPVTTPEKSLRFESDLANQARRPLLDELQENTPEAAEDHVANKEPAMLWQRKDGFGDVFSEGRNSADSGKSDRRPKTERLADQSDNATYHAMNVKLKLLAYELNAAAKKLTFSIAIAKNIKHPDKAQLKDTRSGMLATIRNLDDLARETAKQLSDLNTSKNEPRLAEGGEYLIAALTEFVPVMTDVDDWMVAHGEEAPSWEIHFRSNEILRLIFPSKAPVGKPLSRLEKSSGFVNFESINLHLDAAIVAAESVLSGNRRHADRIVLHAKEIAQLAVNTPLLEGPQELRIQKLTLLVRQVIVDNPYLARSLNEAIDPLRSPK